jgi:hypothetical protein
MDNNLFTGGIPTDLQGMSLLREIRLGWNSLDSTLPTELGLLTELEVLSLENNSIWSSIPSEVGLMSRLGKLEGSKALWILPS